MNCSIRQTNITTNNYVEDNIDYIRLFIYTQKSDRKDGEILNRLQLVIQILGMN